MVLRRTCAALSCAAVARVYLRQRRAPCHSVENLMNIIALNMAVRSSGAIAALALAGSAIAQVSVSAPWARATVPVQKTSGAFMVLQSAQDARLIGVSSPVAASVEIHLSQMDGNMMKMEQVDEIKLPAGKPVNLATGGYHLMLVGLKQQLKEGSTVPLTLVVQSDMAAAKGSATAGTHAGSRAGAKPAPQRLTIQVPVKALTYAPASH